MENMAYDKPYTVNKNMFQTQKIEDIMSLVCHCVRLSFKELPLPHVHPRTFMFIHVTCFHLLNLLLRRT